MYKILKLDENFEIKKIYKKDFKTLRNSLCYLYDKRCKGNFQIIKVTNKCILDVFDVEIGFNEVRAIHCYNGRTYKY